MKAKRKEVEPKPLPTEPTVLCDKCCRMSFAGTRETVWVTCERCK